MIEWSSLLEYQIRWRFRFPVAFHSQPIFCASEIDLWPRVAESLAYDASVGTLYVLFMAVLVHHPEAPPVVAVDNFDHALNPRLARALTRNICEWVTTRVSLPASPHISQSVGSGRFAPRNDDVRLFTVERSHKGKTVVRRVIVDEKLLQYADEGAPSLSAVGNGYFWWRPQQYLMKSIYFVTEGDTDRIILEALVARWETQTLCPGYIPAPFIAIRSGSDFIFRLQRGSLRLTQWCPMTRCHYNPFRRPLTIRMMRKWRPTESSRSAFQQSLSPRTRWAATGSAVT